MPAKNRVDSRRAVPVYCWSVNVDYRVRLERLVVRAQTETIVWRAVAGAAWLGLIVVSAIFFAFGCALQPVAVHVVDEREQPDRPKVDPYDEPRLHPLVREACDALALDCYATRTSGSGVVQVRIVDDAGPNHMGYTEGRGLCRKGLRAEPNVGTIAHELGHVFLLEHVDDPTNLMHGSEREREDDATLEPEQFDTLHASAARFVGGCL